MPRRRPLVPVLLLAATLSVDAVAVYWFNYVSDGPATGALCNALLTSQLSVICIWVAFGRTRRSWGLSVLVVATLAATWTMASLLDRPSSAWDWIAPFGTQTVSLTVLLWIIKRMKWWHRLRDSTTSAPWQFSVMQLLVLMTCAAVLAAAFQNSQVVRDVGWFVAVAAVIDSLLAVAAVLAWAQPWHMAIRIAVLSAISGSAAWLASRWGEEPGWAAYIVANWIMQCLVIFAWLEVGRIIPRRAPDGADGDAGQ